MIKDKGKRGFEKIYFKGKRLKMVKELNKQMIIKIPTPKRWKCKAKKCLIDFKHKHIYWLEVKK